MLTMPSECYLLFCIPCIFLCVCSPWLHSLQLFLELLALSLAPSLEPYFSLFTCFFKLLLVALTRPFFEAFPACVDSLHYPFRISRDHKYSLRARLSSTSEMSTVLSFLLGLILFTIHLEYRWITNIPS